MGHPLDAYVVCYVFLSSHYEFDNREEGVVGDLKGTTVQMKLKNIYLSSSALKFIIIPLCVFGFD